MDQGDTLIITVDGVEVGRMTIPEREHFSDPIRHTFTINLDGRKIAEAIAPQLPKTVR